MYSTEETCVDEDYFLWATFVRHINSPFFRYRCEKNTCSIVAVAGSRVTSSWSCNYREIDREPLAPWDFINRSAAAADGHTRGEIDRIEQELF